MNPAFFGFMTHVGHLQADCQENNGWGSDQVVLYTEWKCADTIGTVPVSWAGHFQCCNINIFSNKIYGSNFIKQHSETVMVWNRQNADCSLRKKITVTFFYNFRHTFVPHTSSSTWSDLRSRGREFEPRPGCGSESPLGKLFTPICLDDDSLRYYGVVELDSPLSLLEISVTHKVTVTWFCFISMPAVFRRHLVGKTLRNPFTVISLKYALLVS